MKKILFNSFLFLFCAAWVEAKTIVVGKGAEYEELRPALKACKNGDEIKILTGVYETNISYTLSEKSNVRIYGEGDVHIWTTDPLTIVFWINECKNVVFENIHFKHTLPGSFYYEGSMCSAGVISIDNSENITIKNCELNGCGTIGVDFGRSENNIKGIVLENNYIHKNSDCAVYYDGKKYFSEEELAAIPSDIIRFSKNRIMNNGENAYRYINPYYDYMKKTLPTISKNVNQTASKSTANGSPVFKSSGETEFHFYNDSWNDYNSNGYLVLKDKNKRGMLFVLEVPMDYSVGTSIPDIVDEGDYTVVWEEQFRPALHYASNMYEYGYTITDIKKNGKSVIPAVQKQAIVAAPSGLNIRQQADVKSKSLVALAYGTVVDVLDEKPIPTTIDGIKGNMVKVKAGDKTGYMFDGYLFRTETNVYTPSWVQAYQMEREKNLISETVYHEDSLEGYHTKVTHKINFRDWAEAYAFTAGQSYQKEIALALFPTKPSKKRTETFKKTGEGDFSYQTAEITVSRDDKGEIIKILGNASAEGGATDFEIVRQTDGKFFITFDYYGD